jgi:orotate phosphoribosyltransferase-like protein
MEAIKSDDGKVRKVKVVISKDGEKKVYYGPISELVLIMHTE